MKAIVGLGNPGDKYKDTRHNAGFIVLQEFSRENNLVWDFEDKYKAYICRYQSITSTVSTVKYGDKEDDVILAMPQTCMNDSGSSVSKLINFLGIQYSGLLIVHDDVDLEFGKIKKQFGGSSAGHHGIINIIEKLGTAEFWRLRIGVGRPQDQRFDIEDWVLTGFTPQELAFIKGITLPLDFNE